MKVLDTSFVVILYSHNCLNPKIEWRKNNLRFCSLMSYPMQHAVNPTPRSMEIPNSFDVTNSLGFLATFQPLSHVLPQS